jgi:hypothetical protein
MSGRVLNFSEFNDKYSSESQSDEKNLNSFTQASSNFEEGFDKDTYNTDQLGPNRPASDHSEKTPPQPGEIGAPKFSSNNTEDMNAPEEPTGVEKPNEEDQSTEPKEEKKITKPEKSSGHPEGEEGDDKQKDSGSPEEEEEEEDDDKEKVEESRMGLIKGFHEFVNERYHDENFYSEGEEDFSNDYSGGFSDDSEDERFREEFNNINDEDEDQYCEMCGDPIEFSEYCIKCNN